MFIVSRDARYYIEIFMVTLCFRTLCLVTCFFTQFFEKIPKMSNSTTLTWFNTYIYAYMYTY